MDAIINTMIAGIGIKIAEKAAEAIIKSRQSSEESYAKKMKKLQTEMNKAQVEHDKKMKRLLEAEISLQEKGIITKPNIVML